MCRQTAYYEHSLELPRGSQEFPHLNKCWISHKRKLCVTCNFITATHLWIASPDGKDLFVKKLGNSPRSPGQKFFPKPVHFPTPGSGL